MLKLKWERRESAYDYVCEQIRQISIIAQSDFDMSGDPNVDELDNARLQVLFRIKEKMEADKIRDDRIWNVALWIGFIGVIIFSVYHGLIG